MAAYGQKYPNEHAELTRRISGEHPSDDPRNGYTVQGVVNGKLCYIYT